MQRVNISKFSINSNNDTFLVSGSKSISQRALIINYLLEDKNPIQNISDCRDTYLLNSALLSSRSNVDVMDSGTTLRFLISLFALQNRIVTLKCTSSLFNRPIDSLINVLNHLGSNIKIHNDKILIIDSHLRGGVVKMDANVTSQFVSSLLLISPYLDGGITICLNKSVFSKQYINMTLDMMNQCGGYARWHDNSIYVKQIKYSNPYTFVESDWSSVSYLYLSFLFSDLTNINIGEFLVDSIQGDSSLRHFFSIFGIKTTFINSNIQLTKIHINQLPKTIHWNFKDNPDLFQTFAVACFGLGVTLFAKGLNTLYFKETNRILSMKKELEKFNCSLDISTKNEALLTPNILDTRKIINVNTHNDHRMAMALAPLVLLNFNISIDNIDVVNKSYPLFWEDLCKFGVSLT